MNPQTDAYRTTCCGYKLLLAEGLTFPPCPVHPELATVWISDLEEV